MRSILLLATLASSSWVVLAQSAPIKFGLWAKEMLTTNSSGAPPTSLRAKSCITPEIWQDMVANASKQREDCTMNTVKTAHGYSINSTCTLSPGVTIVTNGTTTIQDSEHIVSETHSTTTMNGKKRDMESHSTSRFLSANCGAIKPGDPEIEH